MFRDAALIAAKDLRIELASRVTTNQVAPFALAVLVLFAFALDPDTGLLLRATAGLFWIAVLFAGLLAIKRAFAIETADGNIEALRLAGLAPAGIFFGKVAALFCQLAALEVILGVGVMLFYGAEPRSVVVLVVAAFVATVGIAASGGVYGALAAGLRVRDTLLPLLLLPVLAPVLIGATRAFEAALGGTAAEGWPWIALLAVFAVAYLAFGALAFGTLLEDA